MDDTVDHTDFKHCFSGDESLLMHAIFESNLECVKHLINQGVDVNYECNHGMTPLLIAIKMGNLDVSIFSYKTKQMLTNYTQSKLTKILKLIQHLSSLHVN